MSYAMRMCVDFGGELAGMKIATGSPLPLKGVPAPAGRHTRFDEEGNASVSTPKTRLRGVPGPSGKHTRFAE